MIKKFSTLVVSSLGLMALASGCAVDAVESEELLGTEDMEAVVCSNDQATNAIIAGMAVVMAKEVGRWDPGQDLTKTSILRTYSWGSQWAEIVALTQAAKDRCSSRGHGQCSVLQSLLSLQVGGSGIQYGGVQLTDPNVLSSRLVSYYNDQKNCIDDTARNGDNQPQNCPKESNELNFYKKTTSATTCVGSNDFWYNAKYAAGHPMAGQPLSGTDAAQLRNNLKWAGGVQNPYLSYELDPNVVGDVKIDPIVGSTGDQDSSSGSCDAAMNHVWAPNPSPGWWKCDNITDMSKQGQCCTCNGQQRTWKPAVMSGFLQCKL